MRQFVQRHADQILGVLSGFDRIRLRGSLRLFCTEGGVASWLQGAGVALTDFFKWAQGLTDRLRRRSEKIAREAGRPVQYLNGFVNKESLVEKIRTERGVADNGLVAVLSTIETCRSFEMPTGPDAKRGLKRKTRKCLHYYFYWEDGRFGLTQVRLQSWFPFSVHVVLNGREWLARELDQANIGYVRRDNCFIEIANLDKAQKLMEGQSKIDWCGQMNRLLRRVHPQHAQFFQAAPVDYYWTSEQTEWATDILFRDARILSELYQTLVRRGIDTFQSGDVLRFLGHKTPKHGGAHGKYQGVVQSDLKRRVEGIRLKHRAGHNTVKMYNKQPTVLRVETTINDASDLKCYRRKENDRKGKRAWRSLRKSVVDLPRRAQLSQASNDRYLEALGTVACETPLSQYMDKLCRPVQVGKRRIRALRPFEPDDAKLLEVVSRGEHLIKGFRNRDLRVTIYGETSDLKERKRQAARITRKLAILRAHGLIKKIPRTHRYTLTADGTTAITVLTAARHKTLAELTAA
jgi:hypothetical protein